MWRLSALITAGLAATNVIASTWFPGSRTAYNKWHETELERWLSDHDIPYPKAADRKDVEALVDKNWNDYVVEPYRKWSPEQLTSFLQSKGKDIKAEADASVDSLISQVKANWYETENSAAKSTSDVREWILDTWTDSQLKSFCDRHGIPAPNPRPRDTLLQKSRLAYESAVKKLGETVSYPGDWLYETWSDSDLKGWLDTHGFPAPQVTDRNKLIALVRRNSYLAHLKAQHEISRAQDSARAVYATLTDKIINAWSESQLKEFCDENGIPIPQGTKTEALRALVRRNRAEIMGTNVSAQGSKAFGAATSNIQQQYAKATDSASLAAQHAFSQAADTWSDSRLKSYLDARGVPVPQKSTTDELRALVRKHSHKAASGWSIWTFDDYNRENIQNYLSKHGDAAAKKLAKKKDATRDELVSAAQSAYASASAVGGKQYASVTSYLSSATASAKQDAFDTWSESDLKAYLDSYGIPVPQGSKVDELRAFARKQSTYFKYGTSSPSGTVLAKLQQAGTDGWNWIAKQLRLGSEEAKARASDAQTTAAKKAQQLREEL